MALRRGVKVAVLVAFLVPLVCGFIISRADLGLLAGLVAGPAVFYALGGKSIDLPRRKCCH